MKPTQHNNTTPQNKKYGFKIMVEHFNNRGKLINENLTFLILQDLKNKKNNFKEDKQIYRILRNKINRVLKLQKIENFRDKWKHQHR